jgi:hypothetical protein
MSEKHTARIQRRVMPRGCKNTGLQAMDLVARSGSTVWNVAAERDERLAGEVVVTAAAMLAAVEEADRYGRETAERVREIARAFLRIVDGQNLSLILPTPDQAFLEAA